MHVSLRSYKEVTEPREAKTRRNYAFGDISLYKDMKTVNNAKIEGKKKRKKTSLIVTRITLALHALTKSFSTHR